MVQNYIVDKLTLSDLKENGKVVIPNFQRGVVWTKQHRKEFIETVKTGDPFGVVLVSQGSPSEPYYLIDGLQRLSTLKAYMDNPLEFIDENDKFTDQTKLMTVFQRKYESKGLQMPASAKISKEQKSFLKKTISLMKSKKTIPHENDIWEEVSSYLGVDVNSFQVLSAFSDFYRSFVGNLELPDIIIHAIVYQGPKERLPYVFETLNTSSVSLTKYEVFSSQWPTTKIMVNDEELVDKVWSKYDGLKKSSSFEVDVTHDSIRDEGMTLFEYCFGFSELVCDANKPYAYLFNKNKKTTDPTGFELLALACGLQVNKADILWKDEYLGKSSGSLLISIKDALIDSINIVSNTLKDWVYDMNGTPIKNTSTYQIYYMIITVFRNTYSFDSQNKTINKNESSEWVNSFKKNAPKWYLLHILTGFWNQNRQVSDLHALLNETNDIDYSATITKERWDDVIKNYCDSTRDNCTTRNISNEARLIMNYLYKMLIHEDANKAKYFIRNTDNGEEIEFDIEHIVPVAKFDKYSTDFSMSTLGNLCYLPVKDNRSKRDHTIYEYAMDRPSLTFNTDFLDMIDYPSREDLAFIDSTEDQFTDSYNALIKKRENAIMDKFISHIIF